MPPEDNHRVRCRLDDLMQARGFTVAALAEAVGITQANLSVLMRRNIDTSDTCHVRPLMLFPNQPWRCL